MTDEEEKQNGMPETANPGAVSPGEKGIGALLREERERRGLSHRAVAERTRLRAHFVEALEKEEWEVLPPPAFLRGFLRTYARLLSLDERTVLDLYHRAVPAKDGALSPLIEKSGVGTRRRVLLVVCMLIAVAALVFAWKEYVSRYAGPGSEKRELPAAESRRAEVAILRDEGGGLREKGTETVNPPPPESPLAEVVTPPEVSSDKAEGSRVQTPLSVPPGEVQGAAQPSPDRAHPGEHVLQASVSARTWLRIQIDGSEPREYMFQPGSRPEWKARQGFYLFIGNAGGIDLTFDGEGVAKLGGPGRRDIYGFPGIFDERAGRSDVENVYDIFAERGFIEQVSDEKLVRELLESPTTCYIGFDPTATSLHVGSLVPIMSLAHMQRAGHRPIAVVGAGTTLVGDPSGKTEMRRIMSREEINRNAEYLKEQFSRFIDFSPGKALMVNNADWLTKLNYIDFLREIGCHFSVNRMLAAESYKIRLETGLSFIEFNYMLLQAYDFWHLYKHYDCKLQMGGNDQWGNILAGTDLIRRLEGGMAHALTFPLITASSGIKMGKTHKGAVWLSREMTSPYDYYQYWINQDDRDVERFLALFTFLPMEEVKRLGSLQGEELKVAKEVLAYEATRLCHGREEADGARAAARQLFGTDASENSEAAPSVSLPAGELEQGIPAYQLFEKARLCKTRAEARRLIAQGGGYVNGRRIDQFDEIIGAKDLRNNALLLRAGKKRYARVLPA